MFRSPLVLATACLATCLAAADADPMELAKESEARCTATAGDKATPQLVMQKVREAAALVAKDGRTAFAKFKGKDSPFLFCGTYIWIHDGEGRMQMHPIKPKMEGKDLLGLKDSKGKTFFVDMNTVAAAGGGWVDYMWPKPGEKEPSLKVSYVAQAKNGGETFIIGCGVYDIPLDDIKKVEAK
jgi:signal transduction histidine kinase